MINAPGAGNGGGFLFREYRMRARQEGNQAAGCRSVGAVRCL